MKDRQVQEEKNVKLGAIICSYIRKLINVMSEVARKESLALVHSRHILQNEPIQHVHALLKFTTSRVPRNRATYHPQPSQKNRQKLPFASMLFLCQHSHYVSANSKPLLYLFRVYDIFYTLLFLIIFFFVR